MNKEVNFNTAKLLNEKGFEQKERPSYLLVPFQECTSLDVSNHTSGSLGYGDRIGYYLPNKTVNAPTISDVIMWLYENHKIWIYVDGDFRPHIIKDDGDLNYRGDVNRTVLLEGKTKVQYCWDSPTEAYEATITYVLENKI